MSKSLGNFFTVRDLLDQGVSGEVIRFVMLSTHYRKPMDWTEKKRVEAEATLSDWFKFLHGLGLAAKSEVAELYAEEGFWLPDVEVVAALGSDLNTNAAITRLRELFKSSELGSVDGKARFAASLEMIGLLPDMVALEAFLQLKPAVDLSRCVEMFNTTRKIAMETKDFAALDALKKHLADAGVEVRMSKEGVALEPTASFDPTKLEGLL
jgi:cysteinyl-tRNA synthetase